MDMLLFPEQLRSLRKDKNLSVNEVSAYLSEHVKPVSSKTVYGWESGTSAPSSEMLLALCEMYDVRDIQAAFGLDSSDEKDDDSPMHFLTPKEWELIKEYRNRPEYKPVVRKIYDLE